MKNTSRPISYLLLALGLLIQTHAVQATSNTSARPHLGPAVSYKIVESRLAAPTIADNTTSPATKASTRFTTGGRQLRQHVKKQHKTDSGQ